MYSEHFQRLWTDYKQLRLAHEIFKDAQEKAFARFRRAEQELVDAMLSADATNFEIDGMKPYLSADRSCSVNQENTEAVMAWLDEQRGGKDTFMRLALDPWAVKRLIREEIKDGADPSSYPEFLKVAVRPRLNVRGWIGNDKEGGDEEK